MDRAATSGCPTPIRIDGGFEALERSGRVIDSSAMPRWHSESLRVNISFAPKETLTDRQVAESALSLFPSTAVRRARHPLQ